MSPYAIPSPWLPWVFWLAYGAIAFITGRKWPIAGAVAVVIPLLILLYERVVIADPGADGLVADILPWWVTGLAMLSAVVLAAAGIVVGRRRRNHAA